MGASLLGALGLVLATTAIAHAEGSPPTTPGPNEDVAYVLRAGPWHAPLSSVRESNRHEPFVVTDRAWVKREPEAKVWLTERADRAKKTESQVAAARIASGSAITSVLALVLAAMAIAFVPTPRALRRKKATADALHAALHEPGSVAGAGAVSLAQDDRGELSLTADRGALSHVEAEGRSPR